MNNKVYVHYNSNKYDKERLYRAVNDPEKHYLEHPFQYKPHGLWASPVDSEYGWKEWCEDEEFYMYKLEKSFKFTLSPEAKILMIKAPEDTYPYTKEHGLLVAENALDLNKIYSEYDAMEVDFSDNYIELRYDPIFYSWDVDSICVWNPDIIIPVE